MSHSSGTTTAGAAGGVVWAPFTMAQWQELEHQAFIFKYLKAGLPVPPDLLAPIRRSFDSMPARVFHNPTLGYSSMYGKKYDPEPGRCRRTDGKKWRCSKDAYPDSKYCERHMNRSRNRSRKPVESKTISQSLSTVAPGVATASSNGSVGSQSLSFQSFGNHEDLFRGHHGQKPEADKHNFIPEVSGSVSIASINSNVTSEWCLPTAQIASYPLSEPRSGTLLQFSRPQVQQNLQDFEAAVTIDAAMSKQQQEHYFFGMEFNSPLQVKHDHQSLQPLFDEWPKSRQFGSYMGDQKSDKKLHSTTQLSMSMPSDFLSRRAHSPNDG